MFDLKHFTDVSADCTEGAPLGEVGGKINTISLFVVTVVNLI